MKFIYPIDIDATYSVDNGTITNDYLINDGAIDTAATVSNGDRVQFDFSSSVNPTQIVVYLNSGSGSIVVKRTSSKTLVSTTAISTAGWTIIDISSTASDEWYCEFTVPAAMTISEVFFAHTFTFPYQYDLGNTKQYQFGVDLAMGIGGGEFANKRHDAKTLRDWNSTSYSGTNVTAYETMLTAIGGTYAKLLWYDDTSYHYIRLKDTPVFSEETYDRWGFGQGIRTQLQ